MQFSGLRVTPKGNNGLSLSNIIEAVDGLYAVSAAVGVVENKAHVPTGARV